MVARRGKPFLEKILLSIKQLDMWAAVVNIILGVWIMLAPSLFEFEKKAADNNYIVGPLVITIAITAIWEVNRSARYFNLVAGVWLAASPFILAFDSPAAIWNDLIGGLLITMFSLIKGKIKGKYGGGWRSLIRSTNAS